MIPRDCVRAALIFALWTSLLVSIEARRATAASSSYSQRNDIVGVEIQSSSATYKVGEPVLLRIGLKNLSAANYLFCRDGPPWREENLVAGQVVTGERDTRNYKTIVPCIKVSPGQIHWLNFGGTEWTDIGYWSIHLGPGTYRLQGIPFVAGELYQSTFSRDITAAGAGKFVTDFRTPNSNTLTITIVQ